MIFFVISCFRVFVIRFESTTFPSSFGFRFSDFGFHRTSPRCRRYVSTSRSNGIWLLVIK